MLLVSIVLAIVFSMLCVSSYRMLWYESVKALESGLSAEDYQKSQRFDMRRNPRPDFLREAMFTVRIGESGDIKLVLSHNIDISDEDLKQVAAEAEASADNSGFLREYNLRYMKRYEQDGVKIAFIDYTGIVSSMKKIIAGCIFMCAVALAAFFFISLFLSKWALKPVEQAWQRQRQFVADASHELKTPLTVILANTGILKSNRSDTIERQIGWVENTETEAKRMKKLVDNLLFLAKADDAKAPMVYSELNFSDIALGVALTFEPVAYERGIEIDTGHISPEIHVSGDEAQLSQLAGILLDNAVKYSEDGGVVTLSLTVKQDKAVFSVNNVGSYLKTDDLEHVFDRFYRADESRANEGYGLGLAIAKSIAESHNGKISAYSDEEKGVTFTVVLPVCD